MALKLTPLHPLFVAEASGLDITKPISAEDVAEINQAINQYGVLVFRNQPLTQDEQMAFTRSFGPLDIGFKRVSNPHDRLKYNELADISNVAENGEIADRNHRRIVNNMANQMWHSDSSFQQPAARFSMLHSVINPPKGGETEFADMRAAYDTLDDEMKARIEGLHVFHSITYSRHVIGFDFTPEEAAQLKGANQPLVRTIPGSGRKCLYLASHASHIVEWPLPEGRMLLLDLTEHATQREFVYRHAWQPDDLVIWDNRATMHRARPFDDTKHRRELRRTTTLDLARETA